jgi:hypothetical protein
MAITRCYQIHGGSCKNLVSVKGGYICAAGHSGKRSKPTPEIASLGKLDNPASVIDKLSVKDKESLARDASTPPSVLEELAKDRDWEIRQGVAENPSTPPSVLEELAKDRDWEIRQGVAENPSTPPSVLEELASDGNDRIRQRVAQNFFTPISALKILTKEGLVPTAFVRGKEVSYLLEGDNFSLVDEYPDTFGHAYLDRLVTSPLPEDRLHPKTRLLIGYCFTKFAESSEKQYYITLYRKNIQALYPDDQELAEMVGY